MAQISISSVFHPVFSAARALARSDMSLPIPMASIRQMTARPSPFGNRGAGCPDLPAGGREKGYKRDHMHSCIIGFARTQLDGDTTVGVTPTQAAPTCNHCDWAGTRESEHRTKRKSGEKTFFIQSSKFRGNLSKLVPRFDGALEVFLSAGFVPTRMA